MEQTSEQKVTRMTKVLRCVGKDLALVLVAQLRELADDLLSRLDVVLVGILIGPLRVQARSDEGQGRGVRRCCPPRMADVRTSTDDLRICMRITEGEGRDCQKKNGPEDQIMNQAGALELKIRYGFRSQCLPLSGVGRNKLSWPELPELAGV
jgi:hypothetical protein